MEKGEKQGSTSICVPIQTKLIPYAQELVELLHNHGFLLGIITNGTADLSCHPDLNSLFTAFVNSDLCGDRKPTRVPFDKVADGIRADRQMKEIMGIYDSSMYMHVGDDYSSDVEGAHNSGWKSVLISRSSTPYPQGKKAPDLCVKSLRDLYLLFKAVLEQRFLICLLTIVFYFTRIMGSFGAWQPNPQILAPRNK